MTRTAPATSSPTDAEASLLSTTASGASTNPSAPMDTLTKKPPSRPNPPVRTPPSNQPVAPPPTAAGHTPSARCLPSPSGKAAVSEDTAEGASSSEPLRDARELRRWCQMEDCGTHEKMHRYVARHAAVRKAT